jgi:ribonucleoside-diphosphate reductase alpha chain
VARDKGSFPYFDRDQYLGRPFVAALPDDIRDGIARHGIRNSHLIAIAPAGTISLLANNVSSGLEPVFAFRYDRKVLNQDGTTCTFELTDYAWRRWRELRGASMPLPPAFVHAHEIPPRAHLAMQAALQPYVDSSISKTINVPEDYPFAEFADIYRLAFEQGLKGCTTFRPNPITGEVLKGAEDSREAPHCCMIEREAD